MSSKKRILVIAAHPDDEVLGLGGTLNKCVLNGHEVQPIIFANKNIIRHNKNSVMDACLINNCMECCIMLKINAPIFENFENLMLGTIPQYIINQIIEKHIQNFYPEIVLTHHFGDMNIDHQILYESTMVATRPKPNSIVKRVLCYAAPSSTEWGPNTTGRMFTPNWFVNIENNIETKMRALSCYVTETPDPPHPRSLELLRKQAEICGSSVGIKYAEQFMLIRNLSFNNKEQII